MTCPFSTDSLAVKFSVTGLYCKSVDIISTYVPNSLYECDKNIIFFKAGWSSRRIFIGINYARHNVGVLVLKKSYVCK